MVIKILDAFSEAFQEILKSIMKTSKEISYIQVQGMIDTLLQAGNEKRKILVIGAGRSGLVGKAFAMRLMHLGFNVYVIGETITPSIGEDDLVVVISGSGITTLPLTAARMAKSLKAKVLAITSHAKSPLGAMADLVVTLPGREIRVREEEYHSRQLLGEHESLAPLGTIFEDTCLVFLDCIIAELMVMLDITEEKIEIKHATIE
jgi:6-phospho-3-hexuloisomerase